MKLTIREALRREPGRVVVDLGTGALALLAIIAARAGAKHVYAIEVNAGPAESARQAVEAAGLSDRISVLCGFSTDKKLVLPALADLMVHELVVVLLQSLGLLLAASTTRSRLHAAL